MGSPQFIIGKMQGHAQVMQDLDGPRVEFVRLRVAIDDTLRLVADGSVSPVVASTFPFSEANRALDAMVDSKHLGKIVVEVG